VVAREFGRRAAIAMCRSARKPFPVGRVCAGRGSACGFSGLAFAFGAEPGGVEHMVTKDMPGFVFVLVALSVA
jgi:hypothetical protein